MGGRADSGGCAEVSLLPGTDPGSKLVVRSSRFSNCSTTGATDVEVEVPTVGGGAIAAYGGVLEVFDSDFEECVASVGSHQTSSSINPVGGGAIGVFHRAEAAVTNSRFTRTRVLDARPYVNVDAFGGGVAVNGELLSVDGFEPKLHMANVSFVDTRVDASGVNAIAFGGGFGMGVRGRAVVLDALFQGCVASAPDNIGTGGAIGTSWRAPSLIELFGATLINSGASRHSWGSAISGREGSVQAAQLVIIDDCISSDERLIGTVRGVGKFLLRNVTVRAPSCGPPWLRAGTALFDCKTPPTGGACGPSADCTMSNELQLPTPLCTCREGTTPSPSPDLLRPELAPYDMRSGCVPSSEPDKTWVIAGSSLAIGVVLLLLLGWLMKKRDWKCHDRRDELLGQKPHSDRQTETPQSDPEELTTGDAGIQMVEGKVVGGSTAAHAQNAAIEQTNRSSDVEVSNAVKVFGRGRRTTIEARDEVREMQRSFAGTDDDNRFASRALHFGPMSDAARGIETFVCVSSKEIRQLQNEGVVALRREFEQYGTSTDLECLNYVLDGEAGCCSTIWSNGAKMDCKPTGDGNVLEDRRGMRLADFVEHPRATSVGLEEAEVAALRIYTTDAFKSINLPLRDAERRERNERHPLALTVVLIQSAIKKLRGVEADMPTANDTVTLYRGLKNSTVPHEFLRDGGTELAPMVALEIEPKTFLPPRLAFHSACTHCSPREALCMPSLLDSQRQSISRRPCATRLARLRAWFYAFALVKAWTAAQTSASFRHFHTNLSACILH